MLYIDEAYRRWMHPWSYIIEALGMKPAADREMKLGWTGKDDRHKACVFH